MFSKIGVTGEIIRSAKHLRIIAKHGAGYENIDLAAATACGVVVTTTPAANSQSVAEHALALLLAVARGIGKYTQGLLRGRPKPRQVYQGIELFGKVLGVIGVGESGSRLARMAAGGLGMRVLGYDPYRNPWPDGIEQVLSLEALLRGADFVSIHVPLTNVTRNLVEREALASEALEAERALSSQSRPSTTRCFFSFRQSVLRLTPRTRASS